MRQARLLHGQIVSIVHSGLITGKLRCQESADTRVIPDGGHLLAESFARPLGQPAQGIPITRRQTHILTAIQQRIHAPGVKMGHIIAVEMDGGLPLGRARDRVARSGRQQLRFTIQHGPGPMIALQLHRDPGAALRGLRPITNGGGKVRRRTAAVLYRLAHQVVIPGKIGQRYRQRQQDQQPPAKIFLLACSKQPRKRQQQNAPSGIQLPAVPGQQCRQEDTGREGKPDGGQHTHILSPPPPMIVLVYYIKYRRL